MNQFTNQNIKVTLNGTHLHHKPIVVKTPITPTAISSQHQNQHKQHKRKRKTKSTAAPIPLNTQGSFNRTFLRQSQSPLETMFASRKFQVLTEHTPKEQQGVFQPPQSKQAERFISEIYSKKRINMQIHMPEEYQQRANVDLGRIFKYKNQNNLKVNKPSNRNVDKLVPQIFKPTLTTLRTIKLTSETQIQENIKSNIISPIASPKIKPVNPFGNRIELERVQTEECQSDYKSADRSKTIPSALRMHSEHDFLDRDLFAKRKRSKQSPAFQALNQTLHTPLVPQNISGVASTPKVNIPKKFKIRPKSGNLQISQESFQMNRFRTQLTQCTGKFIMLNRILSNAMYMKKRALYQKQIMRPLTQNQTGLPSTEWEHGKLHSTMPYELKQTILRDQIFSEAESYIDSTI